MDKKKISDSQNIPLALTLVLCLAIATLIRLVALAKGSDSGTANLVFVIVMGCCVVLYLIIWAILGESFIPWMMKRFQNRQIASPKQTPRVSTDTSPAEPALPSIAEIKTEAEQKLLTRRTEKLNLFLEYTHLVLGPYVSAEGLERLRDCIARYAHEEALPTDLIPVRVEKLTNFDLFHFGWNMAEYFDIGKKYEVFPWLQLVFANLRQLEPSYIQGMLYTPATKRLPIPHTTLPPDVQAKLTVRQTIVFEISERFSGDSKCFWSP